MVRYHANMDRTGQTAVIFLSRRTDEDVAGYDAAAAAMAAEAARQPGYCGVNSVRGADGAGITISWWADEASAVAWRWHAEHSAIREQGRATWYGSYEVALAAVTRAYEWRREWAANGTDC